MADEFKSNLLVGELTALNRYLKFKLNLQHYRSIKKDEELSQLRYENSMLRRGAGLPETTPSSSSLYTVQLESESDILDDSMSPTMKPAIDSMNDNRKSTADELRRALHNLKLGFFARESDLNERLSVHKSAVRRMHTCNLDLKRDIREVCEHLCEDLNVLDDLLDVTAKMKAGVEERTRNSIGENNSAPQSPTALSAKAADGEVLQDTALGEEAEKAIKRASADGGSTKDDGAAKTNKAKSKETYVSLARMQGPPVIPMAKTVVGTRAVTEGATSTVGSITTAAASAASGATAATTNADRNSEQEVFISGLSVTERVSYFNSKTDFSLRRSPPSGRNVIVFDNGENGISSTQTDALTTANDGNTQGSYKKTGSSVPSDACVDVTGSVETLVKNTERAAIPKISSTAPPAKQSKPVATAAKSSRPGLPAVDETMLRELYDSLLIRETGGEVILSTVDKTELTSATIGNASSAKEQNGPVLTVPTLRAFFLSVGENQLVVDECIELFTKTGEDISSSSANGNSIVAFEQFVKIVGRLRS